MVLKLFHSPGACSLAPHIALEEASLDYELVHVNFAEQQQRSHDYLRINPKGRVPALADGDLIVTESPAVLRYIARLAPEKALWPASAGDDARCAEWLAWLSSGIHVAYAHVRRAERYATGDDAVANVVAKGRLTTRETWLQVEEKLKLGAGPWAAGASYSVADPYLLVFWTWGRGPLLGYEMARDFPRWSEHARRMAERPAVRRAFEQEGIALP